MGTKNIPKLIKDHIAVRRYESKKVPRKIMNKIIDAGRWGPSVHGSQPWRFVVLGNKEPIDDISIILDKKAKKSDHALSVMLRSASKIIKDASFVVVVYNSKDLDKTMSKYEIIYSRLKNVIKIAQLSAIAAAIQNMLLAADDLGIGSCWLDMPILCAKKINNYLGINEELVAILTFGYPAGKGGRAPRKLYDDAVRLI